MSPDAPTRRAGRIHLLPLELAEQIAAGEVVERPGSVVKELVENALDAGARKIEVTLEAGGRRLIRVVDDGCGMTPEEAQLALLRHATSKIKSADDLWSLGTFGFRGEALPSIASVSRFVLSTKVAESLSGFRVTLEGGRQAEARAHGMPDGTQVEVRDLFFNVPARLKFLKTEATEAGNVTDTLLRLSLANPGVHVRLRSNDRMILDLPPVDNFAERVRTALGRRGTGALHETCGDENGVRVHAFVAPPEEASSTPRNTFLFVARRSIRDRALVSALAMAYGDLLEKGRYPLAALFLELPGHELDVNVHPQKLEVRFANPQEVYAAVRHVVAAGIAAAPWRAAHRSFSLPIGAADAASFPHDLNEDPAPAALPGSIDGEGRWTPPGPAFGTASVAPDGWSIEDAARAAARRPGSSTASRVAVSDFADVALAGPPAFSQHLTYVGQVHGMYLVCEAPGEVVLVDQHAALERLAWLRLCKSREDDAFVSHPLLFPVQIDAETPALAAALGADQWTTVGPALVRLGFDVDRASDRRVSLRGVPQALQDAPAKPLLLEAWAWLAADRAAALALAQGGAPPDSLLVTMAAHAAERSGPLPRAAAIDLLAALGEPDFRARCAHGRPVVVRLLLSHLERRFDGG